MSIKRNELSELSRSCTTMSGWPRGAYRLAEMSLYGCLGLGHKLANYKVTFRQRKSPFDQRSLPSTRKRNMAGQSLTCRHCIVGQPASCRCITGQPLAWRNLATTFVSSGHPQDPMTTDLDVCVLVITRISTNPTNVANPAILTGTTNLATTTSQVDITNLVGLNGQPLLPRDDPPLAPRIEGIANMEHHGRIWSSILNWRDGAKNW
uniref:Uncharacterized protein n=1 Tax=Cannabis sativa TaxID=3483 RepID=A0A803QCY8_CANSA